MVAEALEGGGFQMNCYQEETLRQYVKEQCTAEEQRLIEDHLYDCERCLETYMNILDEQANSMPAILDTSHFTDRVFEDIRSRNQTEEKRASANPLIHYFVAAGFTLLLMFSGVFNGLTNWISEDAMNPTKSGSFSDEMLNKTVEILDTMNHNKKEGK